MPKFHQDSNESELGGPNCCSSHLPVVQEGFWRADPGHSAAGRCQRSLLLLEPDQQYSAWVVFQRAGLQHNHFSRQSGGFLSTCARGCERRHSEPPAPHLWLILSGCYPTLSLADSLLSKDIATESVPQLAIDPSGDRSQDTTSSAKQAQTQSPDVLDPALVPPRLGAKMYRYERDGRSGARVCVRLAVLPVHLHGPDTLFQHFSPGCTA